MKKVNPYLDFHRTPGKKLVINPFSFPASAGGLALIGHTYGVAGTGTGDGYTTPSIDTTGSNCIFVAVAHFVITPGTVTDSYGNTWTQLTEYSGGNDKVYIVYCFNPTVGSGHTFTLHGSNVFGNLAVSAWSGLATSPFDVENGNGGTDPLSTGSITPSQANTLVISALSSNGAGTYTINSGFTITDQCSVDGSARGVAMAYSVLASATATNPSWGTGGGFDCAASIASFKY